MRYSAEEKLLHFMIGGGMLFELIIENWMQRPKPDETATALQTLFFGAHEFVGVSLLAIIIMRFLLMAGDRQAFLRLFPWLYAGGRQGLLCELKQAPSEWLSGNLKDTGEQNFLAGGVHGLGLLLALGLGVTGVIIFTQISPPGTMSALGLKAVKVHEILGTLLWVFLIAHISMAIYHQILGHRALQHIFWRED
ncbi:MAG: cytochrome b/b6 domain-containing protein [Mariprofundaceae bacterium]|nr:cytochrome b/b6 domain-containing protein [Mariprofundaceae bacterium]